MSLSFSANFGSFQQFEHPGRWPGHKVYDLLDRGCGKRWLAGLARLGAQQPIGAFSHEPRLPSPDHRLGLARPAHDLGGAAAIGGGKDD
jgi:hypothetical protein